MDMIARKKRLMMMNGIKLALYYGFGLPRYSNETTYDENQRRCSTGPIYVNAGDVLTVDVPEGFKVALGVWNKDRPYGSDRFYSELYGGWNANLTYTVVRDNSFARYVYVKVPESNFEGDELDHKVKIHANGILYYA